MVFVLSALNQALDPCSPARAKKLLDTGKAYTDNGTPFRIHIKDVMFGAQTMEYQLKIDPGHDYTGFCIMRECDQKVMLFAVLHHRTKQIKKNMKTRTMLRNARRRRVHNRYTGSRGREKRSRRPSWSAKRTMLRASRHRWPKDKEYLSKLREYRKQKPTIEARRERRKFLAERRRDSSAKRVSNSFDRDASEAQAGMVSIIDPEWNFKARTTRYGWKNRAGKLPPSGTHVVETILTWINRLRHLCPITYLSLEDARFDTHKLWNPTVNSKGYQEGPLHGKKTKKQRLIEIHDSICFYCGKYMDERELGVSEIDHVLPRSRNGRHNLSNLVLACKECNVEKGTMTGSEYFKYKREGLEENLGRKPTELESWQYDPKRLKDPHDLSAAGFMNTIRKDLLKCLRSQHGDLELEVAPGWMTHENRKRLKLSKEHYFDAMCIGTNCVPESFDPITYKESVLWIECRGHGNRQLQDVQANGYPRLDEKRMVADREVVKLKEWTEYKRPVKLDHWNGLRTGDMIVTADGIRGRVTIKNARKGKIQIKQKEGKVTSRTKPDFKYLRHRDGYEYKFVPVNVETEIAVENRRG